MVVSALQFQDAGPLVVDHWADESSDRLDAIREQLNIFDAPRFLKSSESQLLLELLEGWALREAWAPIIEWASKAILEGCTFRFASSVYRFWLEALIRSNEHSGAFSLCRHLISYRNETDEFLALALFGLSKLDRGGLARPVARRLLASQKRSALVVESLATHACAFGELARARRSVAVLGSVVRQSPENYFSHLNWFESSLSLDHHDQAASALEALKRNFPTSLEPLRTAAQIMMDQGDWTGVVGSLQSIRRLSSNDVESDVALAAALEYKGDLLAARSVLHAVAQRVPLDDYDYSATLASVNYKLAAIYRDESYRAEAIRALRNCLRIAPAYGLPSSNFHVMLHELSAGVSEHRVSVTPQVGGLRSIGRTEVSRFWLCMADNSGWRRLLRKRSFLVKVPEGAGKGDRVFLCRGEGFKGQSSCKIEGTLEILTPAVPDEELGMVAKCGNFKMFDKAVDFAFSSPPVLCRDGHGLLNFSHTIGLYYAEFSSEGADEVVSHLESHSKTINQKKVNNYA
jgi:tetratricopeptide (TPR) repeat protein